MIPPAPGARRHCHKTAIIPSHQGRDRPFDCIFVTPGLDRPQVMPVVGAFTDTQSVFTRCELGLVKAACRRRGARAPQTAARRRRTPSPTETRLPREWLHLPAPTRLGASSLFPTTTPGRTPVRKAASDFSWKVSVVTTQQATPSLRGQCGSGATYPGRQIQSQPGLSNSRSRAADHSFRNWGD
jgi:hypothetical protein